MKNLERQEAELERLEQIVAQSAGHARRASSGTGANGGREGEIKAKNPDCKRRKKGNR